MIKNFDCFQEEEERKWDNERRHRNALYRYMRVYIVTAKRDNKARKCKIWMRLNVLDTSEIHSCRKIRRSFSRRIQLNKDVDFIAVHRSAEEHRVRYDRKDKFNCCYYYCRSPRCTILFILCVNGAGWQGRLAFIQFSIEWDSPLLCCCV